MKMNANEIAQEAISILNKTITNEVFSIIQNTRPLITNYLKSVETEGLDTVNKVIGKAVKEAYGLEDLEEDGRENNPTCTLIQSHQKFK